MQVHFAHQCFFRVCLCVCVAIELAFKCVYNSQVKNYPLDNLCLWCATHMETFIKQSVTFCIDVSFRNSHGMLSWKNNSLRYFYYSGYTGQWVYFDPQDNTILNRIMQTHILCTTCAAFVEERSTKRRTVIFIYFSLNGLHGNAGASVTRTSV